MYLLLLATKSDHFALHAGDSSYSPLPTVPPSQDFSKLGFVYSTVLKLANQAVSHTGSWRSLATAANYLVRIAPIVPGPPPLQESNQTLVWAMTTMAVLQEKNL
ncbi:hypothetical protein DSO57_1014110 [Entomophthora muscae]|uniref:Uncharacterized protein n=1 Tax=Entomophthora muscae TaxID=34485 RepID=A0ACC2UR69_9FUNG|nr:hypothetical protein DSO57_1014110 [Entomophthora muscae]